jgi:hypothetical protein
MNKILTFPEFTPINIGFLRQDDAMGQLKKTLLPSSGRLLSLILDEPRLVAAVRQLRPEVLRRVIQQVGLEDMGEVVALLTTEQLRDVFDVDLWQSAMVGEDEQFDDQRFLLWLEVLLEAGETAAVEQVAGLPEELLFLAFFRHILVLNLDDLAVEMAGRREAVDLAEKALESALSHEFDEYTVISRQHDGWDVILTVLLALEARHPVLFERVLSRCCYASSEHIDENGGLYNVLTAEEMMDEDAFGDRAERRVSQGYVLPSDAAAFLSLTRQSTIGDIAKAETPDPITRAYFRHLTPAPVRDSASERGDAVRGEDAGTGGISPSSALGTWLWQMDLFENASPLLTGAVYEGSGQVMRSAMAALSRSRPTAYETRTSEIVYLANLLVAGYSTRDRPVRPGEGLAAAVAVADAGLRYLRDCRGHVPPRSAAGLLEETSAVKLFRLGWRRFPVDFDLDTFPAVERALLWLEGLHAPGQGVHEQGDGDKGAEHDEE